MNFFSSQKSTPLQAFGNERRDLKRNAGNKNCPEKKPLSPFVPELFQMYKNLPSSKCEHMFLLPKGSAVCIIQVHHPFGLVWFITYSPLAKVRSTLFLCLFFFYQGLIDTINALTDNFPFGKMGFLLAKLKLFNFRIGKHHLQPIWFRIVRRSSCTYRLYHLLVWYVHSIN